MRSTEEGRHRLEKAEEWFTEALVRAGERIENLSIRAAMRRDEANNESTAAQARDSENAKAPSEGGMSYSPTSPADSPRGQGDPESTEVLLPSADDGRQPGRANDDQDAARAGLASRNSDEHGHKRRPSHQAAGERASSSTRTNPQAQEDRKRRSDGDDGDRHDPNRDIDVGEVTAQRKVPTQQRNKWDEDARAMTKGFRVEECRMAMETMRSCLQSQNDLAEIYSPPRVVREANGMGHERRILVGLLGPRPGRLHLGFQQTRVQAEGIRIDQGIQALHDHRLPKMCAILDYSEPQHADSRG